MIAIKQISSEMAQIIMQTSSLDERKLCSGLKQFYCDGESCSGVYTVTDAQIGEKSINGVIYQACLENDCDYVAKWQSKIDIAIAEAKVQQFAAVHNLAPKVQQIWVCQEGAIIIMDAMSIAVSRLIKALSPQQLQATIDYNLNVFRKKIGGDMKTDFVKTVEDLRKLRSDINKKLYARGDSPLPDVETIPDTDEQKENRKRIMMDVFQLLNDLHKLGIVHKDAHLNNFMADKNMKIKIIDFGMATELHDDFLVDYKRAVRNISQYINEGYTNLDYLEEFCKMKIESMLNLNGNGSL